MNFQNLKMFCPLILFQFGDLNEDRIGAWFIRAKTADNEEDFCPKDGCPSKTVLENVPKLGLDDTVIVLLHGNAKVLHIYYTTNILNVKNTGFSCVLFSNIL